MSTFCGQTAEYPKISLDRFDGLNLKNATFFLSHNHRDHTQGLFTDSFIYKLQSSKQCKLYCSEITKQLLLVDDLLQKYLQKWPALEQSIVALPIEESKVIPVIDLDTGQEAEHLTVTLLPAGHCPGSVMFLVEGDQGTVLYTGDFRLDRDDLCKMRHLHSGNSVKPIKSVYIDTTFCVPNALHLPSRSQSAQHCILIIEEWITQSPHHVVHLSHKADLGYEHLYRDLANHFQTKIHVLPKKFNEYKKIGDMQTITTADPRLTQIHACKTKNSVTRQRRRHHLPCDHRGPNGSQLNVRTITVSTMIFVENDMIEAGMKRYGDHYYRVLYSFHSSYAEVRDIVLYLRPSQASPNVIPMNHTQQQIQERLDRFVKFSQQEVENHAKIQETQNGRPLGNIKTIERKRRQPSLSQCSDDANLDFGEMIGTPVKKRPRNNNIDERGDQVIHSERPSEVGRVGGVQSEVTAEDMVAFPLLFGSQPKKKEGDGECRDRGDRAMVASPQESYDPSQSLFSDDGLLPEDKEWLRLSGSVQALEDREHGSEYDYCSETEQSTEEGDNVTDVTRNEEETKQTHTKKVSDSDNIHSRHSNSVEELCGEQLNNDIKPVNNKPITLKAESSSSKGSCSKSSRNLSKRKCSKTSMDSSNTNSTKRHILSTESSTKGDVVVVECDTADIIVQEASTDSSKKKNKDSGGGTSKSRRKKNHRCRCSNNNRTCVNSDLSCCKDCKDTSEKGRVVSVSGGGGDSDDLDNSVQVVGEVVAGRGKSGNHSTPKAVARSGSSASLSTSSDSAIDLEQVFYHSSRERHISEVMNDYPPKGAGSKKEGDTPEEIQRPSVMRYPTSGFHTCVNRDKRYAVQGYHNLITNIEKILKSPTRSDDGESPDVVVVGEEDCRVGGASYIRDTDRSRDSNSSTEDDNRSRPGSTTKTEKTSVVREEQKNTDVTNKKNAATTAATVTTTPDITTPEEEVLKGNNEKNDSEVVGGDNSGEGGGGGDRISTVESVECIDLTNEDEEEDEVQEEDADAGIDYSNYHGSSCYSDDWSCRESELSSAHESEGDKQNDSVDKDKLKRLTKKRSHHHNHSNDFSSSDSESDAEGYQSENWFMDLRKFRPQRLRNGLGEESPSVVRDNEVIVLDDTSNEGSNAAVQLLQAIEGLEGKEGVDGIEVKKNQKGQDNEAMVEQPKCEDKDSHMDGDGVKTDKKGQDEPMVEQGEEGEGKASHIEGGGSEGENKQEGQGELRVEEGEDKEQVSNMEGNLIDGDINRDGKDELMVEQSKCEEQDSYIEDDGGKEDKTQEIQENPMVERPKCEKKATHIKEVGVYGDKNMEGKNVPMVEPPQCEKKVSHVKEDGIEEDKNQQGPYEPMVKQWENEGMVCYIEGGGVKGDTNEEIQDNSVVEQPKCEEQVSDIKEETRTGVQHINEEIVLKTISEDITTNNKLPAKVDEEV